jgi:hypothetical protein
LCTTLRNAPRDHCIRADLAAPTNPPAAGRRLRLRLHQIGAQPDTDQARFQDLNDALTDVAWA